MRAPMMPNGTAHTAMSSEAQGATPRLRIRCSMIRTAATMPRTMQSAYARMGRPSTCQTDVVGLGMAATITGAHATVVALAGKYQGAPTFAPSLLFGLAYALRQFRAERAQPGQAGRPVGRLQHAADQRAAHDHAVGERG